MASTQLQANGRKPSDFLGSLSSGADEGIPEAQEASDTLDLPYFLTLSNNKKVRMNGGVPEQIAHSLSSSTKARLGGVPRPGQGMA